MGITNHIFIIIKTVNNNVTLRLSNLQQKRRVNRILIAMNLNLFYLVIFIFPVSLSSTSWPKLSVNFLCLSIVAFPKNKNWIENETNDSRNPNSYTDTNPNPDSLNFNNHSNANPSPDYTTLTLTPTLTLILTISTTPTPTLTPTYP